MHLWYCESPPKNRRIAAFMGFYDFYQDFPEGACIPLRIL